MMDIFTLYSSETICFYHKRDFAFSSYKEFVYSIILKYTEANSKFPALRDESKEKKSRTMYQQMTDYASDS